MFIFVGHWVETVLNHLVDLVRLDNSEPFDDLSISFLFVCDVFEFVSLWVVFDHH